MGMKKVQSKVIAGHHINSCWIETGGVTLINNLSYSIIVFGYISLAAERETQAVVLLSSREVDRQKHTGIRSRDKLSQSG